MWWVLRRQFANMCRSAARLADRLARDIGVDGQIAIGLSARLGEVGADGRVPSMARMAPSLAPVIKLSVINAVPAEAAVETPMPIWESRMRLSVTLTSRR